MQNLPWLSLSCVILLFAAVAGAQDAVHKWVDKEGQIHITTTPPPKGAAAVPEQRPTERWVYEWLAPDGSFRVTTTAPPKGAKVKERLQDPRAEAGASQAPANDGTLPVSSLRSPAVVGQRAPNLEYLNALGDDVALADLRGQIVWLVFASGHSEASLTQARALAALRERFDDKVSLLFVLGAGADVRAAQDFARTHSLDADMVLAATPDAFPMGSVPYSVFVDRAGRIARVHSGSLGIAEASAAIDALR